jgi:hypothetical protein
VRMAWWLHLGIHETARMNPDHYVHDTEETDSLLGLPELEVGLAKAEN